MNLSELIPSASDYLSAISGEIATITTLFILRLLGVDLFPRTILIFNYIRSFIWKNIYKKSIILVYTDADDRGNSLLSLCTKIKNKANDKNLKILNIDNPENFSSWPTNNLIDTIIVLITDVSTLSSNPQKRDTIQNKFTSYVKHGGTLILGHDILYRRSKNEILQDFCNVVLTKFIRCEEPITYIKNTAQQEIRTTKNTKLLDNLPESLELDDREIVVGMWGEHVEYIYVSATDPSIPLVTRQEIGNGVVFWLNSGDHTEEGPPPSLAGPADEFVVLITSLITHGKL